ncbi:MAG: hypothetical protein R2695_18220 [Acidimicrobiales bacterium]
MIQTRLPSTRSRAAVRADPRWSRWPKRIGAARWASPRTVRRRSSRAPGPAVFLAEFGQPAGVRIRGPVDERWLLHAADHSVLLDAGGHTLRRRGCGSRSIPCEYERMRRPWIVPVLIVLAVVGAVLVVTADADEAAPPLEAIVTDEGLGTRIPQGWVVSTESAFEFTPPGGDRGFDQWMVARGCPPDGCRARSLAEWMALAGNLPTFTNVRDAEGTDTFNLTERGYADAVELRAQTESGGTLVFAAHFRDGAASYVACSARLDLGSDQRLADELVSVCRTTTPVD